MHHMRRKPRTAIPARAPATPPTIVVVLGPLEESAEEVVVGDRADEEVSETPGTTWVVTEGAWAVVGDWMNLDMTCSTEGRSNAHGYSQQG
jgi:hypothetical protein